MLIPVSFDHAVVSFEGYLESNQDRLKIFWPDFDKYLGSNASNMPRSKKLKYSRLDVHNV